jgi:thioester reductase-like protein
MREAQSTATPGLEELLDDAVLPADVRPLSMEVQGMRGGLQQARHVLMTGATGFIGRWLANEILAQSAATLTCIVRPSKGDAIARLHGALASTGLDGSVIERRTRVLEGDVREPDLGLSAPTLDALSRETDAICHCAAIVNWVLPYHVLKASNVDATRDLLRLAARRSVPFHFISSLTVSCTAPPPAVQTASFDAKSHLQGQHLGYAQAKTVAEMLVREAGRRGLPVAIYRPSFIAGHSMTGAFNQDDILARVVSGCVRMRTAPDLDWILDCLPVDTTAQQIVGCSDRGGVIHLTHPRPRHWRECVLWMRLYGYDVRLVPYQAWLRQLEEETGPSGDRLHPLRPLRSFFLHRPAGPRSLTLPEVMLERNRRTAGSADINNRLPTPPLDAGLLQRYFDAFVESGVLPATARRNGVVRTSEPDAGFFARALDAAVSLAEPLGRLSDHSIVSELTSWKSGQATGLHRYRLRIDDGPKQGEREVVVKIKPSDDLTIEVGEALTRLCSERAGAAYARWSDRLGFAAAHLRELALYEQDDPRFRRHTPAVLGTLADPGNGVWAVVLESVTNARLRDSVDRPESWTAADVDCAIRGLATLQSVWYGRESQLRQQPWIGYVSTASEVAEMSDLWTALAAHAAPRFSAWADPALATIHRRLIDTIQQWWPALEALPRTLIHNDFNPRNICLHGADRPSDRQDGDDTDSRLIAYDWELACVGAPQRDLAELLCFVLSGDASDRDIDCLIERHRAELERETSTSIDRATWEEGFRAAVFDLMLNRLPMYALVHRVRRQSFLPRVVQTWRRLYGRFPL